MQSIHQKSIHVLFLLMSFQFLLPMTSNSYAAGPKNILILHSYHQGYKWTDDQQRGIMSALKPMTKGAKFYFEYMGTKWVADTSFFEQLRDVFKRRYANIPLDVIIATDNDAFNFLRKYRDEMFGAVPVVFCGVNWLKPEDLQGRSLYTGVNEDADIKDNIDLMLRLHPRTTDIYVIADLTTTGQLIHHELQEVFPLYKDRVAFHVLDDMQMPQILEKVSRLSGGSVILITIFQKDKSGKFFEFNEIAEQVSRSSKVPVYGLWDFHLGYGIIGGMLTSGYAQGTAAGEISLRVLNGVSLATIPVVMKSPNRYMFDYLQLRRFGIHQANLPAGSIVINEPVSFYAQHKLLVVSVSAVFFVLSGMVVVLLLNIHRRQLVELQLRQTQAGLENRVKERTDALNKEKELLRESEGSYRNQFAMNSAVMLLIDPANGAIVDANLVALSFYGYSLERLLAMRVVDMTLLSAEELQQVIDAVMQGCNKRFQFRQRMADGSLRDVEMSLSPIQLERRFVLHAIVFDITHQKRDEQVIRENQERLTEQTARLSQALSESDSSREVLASMLDDINTMRIRFEKTAQELDLILSSTSDAIFGLDGEGRFIFVNTQVTRMFDYTAEEMLGKVMHSLCHHSRPDGTPFPASECLLNAALRDGQSRHGEEYFWRKGGTGFYIEYSAAPLMEGGRHSGLVISFRDITERKKTEAQMNKMRLQLVQSDKLSTLGEMATGMAHEINQPLNAIALIATMFKKYMQKKVLTDERLTEGIRDIEAMVQRMSRTITHVRVFARQDTMEMALIDLPPTIEAALNLMGEQLRMHEVEVVKDIDAGLPQINGSSHQLEQVWINFISNARDSMDEKQSLITQGVLSQPGYQKKLQITVSHDKTSNMVLVAFCDNGKGLTEEQSKRVFEPFFTTKDVGKGTGLGLSISMGIIESHKGRIKINGREGEGATLKVYLPVEQGA